MGLVYLPTFTNTSTINVGKYTMHGSYGLPAHGHVGCCARETEVGNSIGELRPKKRHGFFVDVLGEVFFSR